MSVICLSVALSKLFQINEPSSEIPYLHLSSLGTGFTFRCKFTFIKNDAKKIILLTIYIFQVCSASAPPRDETLP